MQQNYTDCHVPLLLCNVWVAPHHRQYPQTQHLFVEADLLAAANTAKMLIRLEIGNQNCILNIYKNTMKNQVQGKHSHLI